MRWHGFTTKWYQALWYNQEIWNAALNSLLLGLASATFATVIGGLAAVNLYRYRFIGKRATHGCLLVLLIVPDLMFGIALLLLFNFLHIQLGFLSLLTAHITFCLPFVAITVASALKSLDKNLFEAAQDLGGSEVTILAKVMCPILWPALAASWLLSFTLSLDDVMISYFVSGPKFEILPLRIFSLAKLGVTPELNALCAILFGLTLCLVLTAHTILKRQSSERGVGYVA